ncbi:small ribosomal subunit Rsm22 family protein [Treponema denticola]|uniref:small ribosomal subunit Rsm22 family protein n=1 Tax=Treponema denticola TaxID=158 RepID=UPI003CFE90B4
MTEQNKPFYEKFVKKNEAKIHHQKKREIDEDLNTEKQPEKKNNRKEFPVKIVKTKNTGKNIFKENDEDTKALLNSFDLIIKDALKLSSKQVASVPKDIRILFHELTNERGSRKVNYLNNPVKLTAYIYHYMWWNLVRISKLIGNLDFDLKDGDIIADFGCGPMTLMCAFWIAKPELRSKKLNWYCADISGKALAAGEALVNSLFTFTNQNTKVEQTSKWKLTKLNGSFGLPLKEKANLFVSANMFNEIFWDSSIKIDGEAERAARTIQHYLQKNGAALIIEPGIPLAGEFVSTLRKNFIEKKYKIISPCPHSGICPIPGKKTAEQKNIKYPIASDKWCHFSFYADDAPPKLVELSEAARLEKTRASLSFIYCREEEKKEKPVESEKGKKDILARISSEIIKLGDGKIGRYACSEKGFLLLTEKKGSRSKLKEYVDGSLIKIENEKINRFFHDRKTGALIIRV